MNPWRRCTYHHTRYAGHLRSCGRPDQAMARTAMAGEWPHAWRSCTWRFGTACILHCGPGREPCWQRPTPLSPLSASAAAGALLLRQELQLSAELRISLQSLQHG